MSDDAEKRRPISAAQWLAARAISEAAPPTRNRVAAMLGCDVSAVYARAAAEGWQCADYRPPATRAAWRHFMEVAFGDTVFGAEPGLAGGVDADWADGDAVVPARPEAARSGGSAGGFGPEADAGDDPLDMLSRGVRFMARRFGRLMRQAERGGQISKQEIDSLAAMMRVMERWETLAKERAKQEEAKSDEDLAETLRIINRKIVELAHEEAVRLVASGATRKRRAKGRKGMDHPGSS